MKFLDHRDDRALMVQVFRENHCKMRIRFFQEPMVKYLWENVFVVEYGHEITQYMRFVRSQSDQGDFKYFRLMQELLTIETTHNVKLLPDSCKDA